MSISLGSRIARQHTRSPQEYQHDFVPPPVQVYSALIHILRILVALALHAWHAKSVCLCCGFSFRRAVQFNNNSCGGFGGGIAVEGGDVT